MFMHLCAEIQGIHVSYLSLPFPLYLLGQSLSLNPDLTVSVSLISHLAHGMSCICLLQVGTKDRPPHLYSIQIDSGNLNNLVLTLASRALYLLSHLSSLHTEIFIGKNKTLLMHLLWDTSCFPWEAGFIPEQNNEHRVPALYSMSGTTPKSQELTEALTVRQQD